MVWIIGFIAFWAIAFFIVDYLLRAPAYKGPETFHFNGKKFGHPYHPKGRSLFDIIKWSLTGDRGEWKKVSGRESGKSFSPTVNDESIAVTFVNHSTFLIQCDGLNILTDPIWSDRASPYSWIGPERMRPPGIRFDELPEIDLVLISHNHYDHLDLPTVLRLNERFSPFFVTSLGVAQYLQKQGIDKTTDLDWWKEYNFNNKTKITATPAKHFSGRGVLDRDRTLWCGYVIQSEEKTVYFVGDTAYGGFFSKIGKQFPSIDLSFIPIGAYKPRWFMQDIHCSPEEAVKIHRDVNSAQSVGMHFGTFPLADEGMEEPKRNLERAKHKYRISPNDFITLKEGESQSIIPARTAIH